MLKPFPQGYICGSRFEEMILELVHKCPTASLSPPWCRDNKYKFASRKQAQVMIRSRCSMQGCFVNRLTTSLMGPCWQTHHPQASALSYSQPAGTGHGPQALLLPSPVLQDKGTAECRVSDSALKYWGWRWPAHDGSLCPILPSVWSNTHLRIRMQNWDRSFEERINMLFCFVWSGEKKPHQSFWQKINPKKVSQSGRKAVD